MDISKITNETVFDPTPRLVTSPIQILFVSFNKDDKKCSYCEMNFTYNNIGQPYCQNCLTWYIKYLTDHKPYLDVQIKTSKRTRCSSGKHGHRGSKFSSTDIHDWCM